METAITEPKVDYRCAYTLEEGMVSIFVEDREWTIPIDENQAADKGDIDAGKAIVVLMVRRAPTDEKFIHNLFKMYSFLDSIKVRK